MWRKPVWDGLAFQQSFSFLNFLWLVGTLSSIRVQPRVVRYLKQMTRCGNSADQIERSGNTSGQKSKCHSDNLFSAESIMAAENFTKERGTSCFSVSGGLRMVLLTSVVPHLWSLRSKQLYLFRKAAILYQTKILPTQSLKIYWMDYCNISF